MEGVELKGSGAERASLPNVAHISGIRRCKPCKSRLQCHLYLTLWVDQSSRTAIQSTTEWLKHQKFISSGFWRLKARDRGVGRIAFFQGLSPKFVDGYHLPVSVHCLYTVCICVLIYLCLLIRTDIRIYQS